MKSLSALILQLTLAFISCVIAFISFVILPNYANELAITYPEYAFLHYPLLIGIWVTLIPFYLAVYKAFISINQLVKAKATASSLNTSLTTIFYSALSIIFLYFIGIFVLFLSKATHPGIVLFGLLVISICFLIMAISRFLSTYLINTYKAG